MGGGAAEPQTASTFGCAPLIAVHVGLAPPPDPAQVQVAVEPAVAERVFEVVVVVPEKQKSVEMTVLEPVYEYVVAVEPQTPLTTGAGPLIAVHVGLVPPPNPVQVHVAVELAATESVFVEGAVPAEHNCTPPKISDEPVYGYV